MQTDTCKLHCNSINTSTKITGSLKYFYGVIAISHFAKNSKIKIFI